MDTGSETQSSSQHAGTEGHTDAVTQSVSQQNAWMHGLREAVPESKSVSKQIAWMQGHSDAGTHKPKIRNSKCQPTECRETGTQGQNLKVSASRTHRRRTQGHADAGMHRRRISKSESQPAECMNACYVMLCCIPDYHSIFI